MKICVGTKTDYDIQSLGESVIKKFIDGTSAAI